MPTALYQSDTNDGYAGSYNIRSWDDTRKLATADFALSTTSQASNLPQHISGRGAIVTQIDRMFFEFDTSGISVAPTVGNYKYMEHIQGQIVM